MHLPENTFLQFLILHGYWFAVPIMILEGPIATIVMAFFASFGYFNPFVVLFFGFFSDLISDSVFYSIGFFHGQRFIGKFGKYFKLSDQTFTSVKNFYDVHGGKSIFLAKILTGIVPPVFIVAGYSRMSLKKFYLFAALGGVIWSGGLVALGYYFGSQFEGRFENIGRLLGFGGLFMASLLGLFVFYKVYLHKVIEQRLKLVFRNSNNQDDSADLSNGKSSSSAG